MGSDSDLPVMQQAADVLAEFAVPYELTIVSAHRTPKRMFAYAEGAAARGLDVIIAGAGEQRRKQQGSKEPCQSVTT